ncbi:sel1 repeat family protein [bacterium]|nr:sel1 repeat family protein [bacterium]
MIEKKEIIKTVKLLLPVILIVFAILLLIFLIKGWTSYTTHNSESAETAKMIEEYHAVDAALEDMKKCKKGDDKACLRSGIYYLDGKFVSPNRKKAGRFLYRACRLKNPIGCYELGSFWGKGRKAKKYYKKACAMDYNPACKALHNLKK